jgi:hypothetical protein
MRRFPLLASFVVTCSVVASAQSSQPYVGLEQRPIKALSHQQVDDLQAGRGMGLALAAELNGYPGPSHVLELGDRLDLTADQRIQVQHLFDAMKQEALPLGNKLVALERELDQLFSTRAVTEESLKATVAAISETHGQLRGTQALSLDNANGVLRVISDHPGRISDLSALRTEDHLNADSTMRPRISAVSEYFSV